jgi:hypothetical protein
LSKDEVRQRAKQLAEACSRKEQLKGEGKLLSAGHKEKEKTNDQEIARLTAIVNSSKEARPVLATWVHNWTDKRMELTREDNAEILEHRAMSEEEKQAKLFDGKTEKPAKAPKKGKKKSASTDLVEPMDAP